MAAAMLLVKASFRKLFRKFSTAKQRLLPSEAAVRSHLGGANPTVNGLVNSFFSKIGGLPKRGLTPLL
jgi:hypothetical protein